MDGRFDDWSTIVGIVGDVRHRGPEAASNGEVYLHYLQRPAVTSIFSFVLGTSGDPGALSASARDAAHALDPEAAIRIRSFEEVFATALAERRFNMSLVGAFAAVALALALAGLYAVMAYSVLQRTHEIGIRMAVGAAPHDVLRLVLSEAARLILAGLTVGLAGSLGLGRALQGLVFGIGARDPLTLGAVAALMGGVALLAAYVPAARAARVDPLIALAGEGRQG